MTIRSIIEIALTAILCRFLYNLVKFFINNLTIMVVAFKLRHDREDITIYLKENN